MLSWTVGKDYHTGYELKITCVDKEEFAWHECKDAFFRIILLEEGVLPLNLNNANIMVNSPCILCLNNRDIVRIKEIKNFKAKSIYFHPKVLNSVFNEENIFFDDLNGNYHPSVYHDRFFLLPFIQRDKDFHGCINLGINLFNNSQLLYKKIKDETQNQMGQYWPCRSRSFIIELLILLQQISMDEINMDSGIEVEKSDSGFDDVLTFLHTNYAEKITLNELSSKFNINRTTLNEYFYKLTGSSIISYLIKHRLKIANSLLRDTELPIGEISQRVGFNDAVSFSRSFKKHYDLAPASFRKMYGNAY